MPNLWLQGFVVGFVIGILAGVIGFVCLMVYVAKLNKKGKRLG